MAELTEENSDIQALLKRLVEAAQAAEQPYDKTRLPDVEVELGFTKSMGKDTFESLRVDIRHRGSREDGETINQATKRVYENLEEVIVKAVSELDEALGPRGRSSTLHANR